MNPSNMEIGGAHEARVTSMSVSNRSPRSTPLERHLEQTIASRNGAGVNVTEVTRMVQHEARIKTEYQRMKWLLAWVSIMLAVMAIVGGIAANKLLDSTKSTTTEEDGTMVSADGEFVIATAAATKQAPMSSFLHDDILRELKVLSVRNAQGASVHLNILGFVRLPKQQYRNSLVKLFTAPGVLLLDGEKLTFDSDITKVFSEAGFEAVVNMNNVDGAPGRHLLAGLTDLIGMFNFVGKFTDDSTFRADEQPAHDLATKLTWTALPAKFKLTATGYTQCVMPRMSVAEQEEWCRAHGSVSHPSAAPGSDAKKAIAGQFFTRTMTLSHDKDLGRSVVEQSVSWDKLQRQDMQVEDAHTGIVKSASLGVDGRLHSCEVGQLPSQGSIFDNAQASSAHVIDVDGDDVFAVGVDTYVNGFKLEDGKVAMDIELRIWQSEHDGAWTRFQVYDRQNYGTPQHIEGGTTWATQTFYDVHTMEPVAGFAPDTFNLAFTGPDANCESNAAKLEAVDEHPSSPMSFAYLAWESEHESADALAAVELLREPAELDEHMFQHVHSDEREAAAQPSRRLLSTNVDRAQLLSSVSSYVAEGDTETANELADGIQRTIDTAVAKALADARAADADRALPPARMPRAMRVSSSRALTSSNEKAKCYQFPPKGKEKLLGILGMEFKMCFGPSLKVDAMLKWQVHAPHVPVVGVSTHAKIDALYKNNGLTTLGDFSGGGCVKFTVGADALPALVTRGCKWLDYKCSFDLAEICVKYDTMSHSVTGTGSVGPKQLQATFKLNIPIKKNSVNKLLGYVKGDIGWGLSFTENLVDKQF